jgi:very-short-patch-repair endonuclease
MGAFDPPFRRWQGEVQVYNSVVPIKDIITGQNIKAEKIERAREMRKEMTPAKKVLWEELRGNKPGSHFRRQQVIAGFIVDFYCHAAGLIIELDGDVHRRRQEYDEGRNKILENMELRVVRFSNEEVLSDLPRVLNQLNKIRGNK